MGLNLACNEICQRVGAYSYVETAKNILLRTALYYCIDIQKKGTDDFGVINDLINHIRNVLKHVKSNVTYKVNGMAYRMVRLQKIDYDYLETNLEEIRDFMELYNIYGIIHWIRHSDCNGILDSIKAESIIKTLQITVKPSIQYFIEEEDATDFNHLKYLFGFDHVDEKLSGEEIVEKYYLYNVFNESIKSGEDIIFC